MEDLTLLRGFLDALKFLIPILRCSLLNRCQFFLVFVDAQTSVYLFNEHRIDLEGQFFANVDFPLAGDPKAHPAHLAQVIIDDPFDETLPVRIRILKVEEVLFENSIKRICFLGGLV